MTTYCGSRRIVGHGEVDICGQKGWGGIYQCGFCKAVDMQKNLNTAEAKITQARGLLSSWLNGDIGDALYTAKMRNLFNV